MHEAISDRDPRSPPDPIGEHQIVGYQAPSRPNHVPVVVCLLCIFRFMSLG